MVVLLLTAQLSTIGITMPAKIGMSTKILRCVTCGKKTRHQLIVGTIDDADEKQWCCWKCGNVSENVSKKARRK
jgi:hypothetical protein